MMNSKENMSYRCLLTILALVGWMNSVSAQSLDALHSIVVDDATANGPVLTNNVKYGVSVASLGDLDGDGVVDIAVGSEKYWFNTGIVYIHFLNSDGSVKSTSVIDGGTNNGPSITYNDKYGVSLVNMGDLDGDGVVDLAVGAFKEDGGSDKQGVVYIHFLNSNGSLKETLELSSDSNNGPSLNDKDEYGISVANIGDLDNNGYNDIVIGARKNDTGGKDRGAAHIHFLYKVGGVIAIERTVKLSSDTDNGASLSNGDNYGTALYGIGDLNGDGVEDLAVGAEKRNIGGSDRGAIFIHFMNSDGSIDNTVTINHNTSNGPSLLNKARYGSAIASIGDLNNDGIEEIAVGAFNDNTEGDHYGSVYIHFLNNNGSVDSTWQINNTTTGQALTTNSHGHFGRAITPLGDINGDGFVEFAIGEPGDSENGSKRGAVHIISLNGSIEVIPQIIWNGISWSGGESSSVSGGPSDENADAYKVMIIQSGNTAIISEDIKVASLQVDSNAILQVSASQCMTVLNDVMVHDSAKVILVASSDSAYAQYYGNAMANTTVEMMIEQYGWHQIASSISGATLADLEAENSQGNTGHIIYSENHIVPSGDSSQIRWYETQDYNGGTNIGFGEDDAYSDAYGTWYGGIGTDSFDGRNGYMIFVNATLTQDAPLPLKLKIEGITNDSSRSTSTDIDNYGWTMVSNPYPCAIDWETIESRLGVATNDYNYDFLPTVSIWEPANQNYATYLADGSGTSGVSANNNGTGISLTDGGRFIAPFQAFWVQRSDYVGEDDGTSDAKLFSVLPTDRAACEQPKHFKQSASNHSLLKLKISNQNNHYTDELIIRFGEEFEDGYSASKDAHKLASSNPDVAMIYTKLKGESLVIHSRSIPDEKTSIPLWMKSKLGAELKIDLSGIPVGWTPWLLEVATGNTYPFDNGSFEFVNFEKGNTNKFNLILREGASRPEPNNTNVFINDNRIELVFEYPGIEKQIQVKDILGRVLYAVKVIDDERLELAFDAFEKQTYLIHVVTSNASKLFKVVP